MNPTTDERRRHIRIPVSGPVRWQSRGESGCCELLNVSPGGTAFQVPVRVVHEIGPDVTLDVELAPDVNWRLVEGATVVRREIHEDGTCTIAVTHPPADREG